MYINLDIIAMIMLRLRVELIQISFHLLTSFVEDCTNLALILVRSSRVITIKNYLIPAARPSSKFPKSTHQFKEMLAQKRKKAPDI